MGRGPCTFKEADITRAVRAVKKAGADAEIKIDLGNGKVMRIMVKAGNGLTAPTEINEWDAEYGED
jgi:hypothetical protein